MLHLMLDEEVNGAYDVLLHLQLHIVSYFGQPFLSQRKKIN